MRVTEAAVGVGGAGEGGVERGRVLEAEAIRLQVVGVHVAEGGGTVVCVGDQVVLGDLLQVEVLFGDIADGDTTRGGSRGTWQGWISQKREREENSIALVTCLSETKL